MESANFFLPFAFLFGVAAVTAVLSGVLLVITNVLSRMPENQAEAPPEGEAADLDEEPEERSPRSRFRLSVYNNFPTQQEALDYFWRRRRTATEAGRLYERYIGWRYEMAGWSVEYSGVSRGRLDYGRDLICRRDGQVRLVQCKRWALSRTVHVKYIHQLYGTLCQYVLENPSEFVKGVFFSTTRFSAESLEAAEEFEIELHPAFTLPERFPIIKCKVYPDGHAFYHLPWDRSYGSVHLDLRPREGLAPRDCFCETIAEATAAGFQRGPQ